jgi:hypothetical protein
MQLIILENSEESWPIKNQKGEVASGNIKWIVVMKSCSWFTWIHLLDIILIMMMLWVLYSWEESVTYQHFNY